ncbi:MAG: YbaK/EbsC family protein [Sulfolobales archaeon]|jgi:Cys-tRNA(Pro) deacylase
MSIERFIRCISSLGIWYKHIVLDKSTRTAREAAEALGISISRIIKTILLVDDRGRFYIAIVPGDKRVDLEKIRILTKSRIIRLANNEEILRITGFEAGALPPICIDGITRFFIDSEVLKNETVLGGGGTVNSLIEIKPYDIVRASNAIVDNISEHK